MLTTKVPVNPQYVFETKERGSFYANQFLTKEEKKDLENIVRNGIEGKEFDCGDIPLSVTCELVSTCNLNCTMLYNYRKIPELCNRSAENDALENC